MAIHIPVAGGDGPSAEGLRMAAMVHQEMPAPAVALCGGDGQLRPQVADVVAAAGMRMLGADGIASAAAVLIGLDVAAELRARGVPRRARTLVVGDDGREDVLWRAAAELGTAGAVSLPSGREWLVRWLRDRGQQAAARPCSVVAVVGACGGAGVSTFAAALAVVAAKSGLSPLLVDGNPGPSGPEVLLGEEAPVNHWQRFAGTRGFINGSDLDGLPKAEGVRYLGWAGEPSLPGWEGALESVIGAAAAEHHLVVVDAARELLPVMPRSARAVLIVPASARGVVSARALLARMGPWSDAAPVVVLRDLGGITDPRGWRPEFPGHDVHVMECEPKLVDDEEAGRPPGVRTRSPLARLARQVLAVLAPAEAAA